MNAASWNFCRKYSTNQWNKNIDIPKNLLETSQNLFDSVKVAEQFAENNAAQSSLDEVVKLSTKNQIAVTDLMKSSVG